MSDQINLTNSYPKYTSQPASDVGYQNGLTNTVLSNPTLPVIRDARGPRVYDLTMTASTNGSDETYKDKPGV